MGIHTKRNFIRTATAVSMKPQPTCVDTSKGHKQLLENSGLVPKYTKKKVFFHHVFTEELFSESDNFRKIGNRERWQVHIKT